MKPLQALTFWIGRERAKLEEEIVRLKYDNSRMLQHEASLSIMSREIDRLLKENAGLRSQLVDQVTASKTSEIINALSVIKNALK